MLQVIFLNKVFYKRSSQVRPYVIISRFSLKLLNLLLKNSILMREISNHYL